MHDILYGESLINDRGRREDDHREKMTSYPGKEMFSRARSARCNRLQTERLKDTLIDPHPHSSMDEYGGRCGLDFGHVSVMGRRRVMEDAVVVAPPVRLAGEYSFFAVYDGHGGAEVAEGCCERLHVCLEKHVEEAARLQEEEEFDWEKVMGECFSAMDEEFRSAAEVGSTAVVVLVSEEEVVVANCGDSRAVLCRDGVPVPLSRDHKPDQPDEKRRIEAAGGNILNWNGWRVEGMLATSRSLGDHSLKPYVISEPEVTVTKRTESDDFLVIATDGLWDVLCNTFACQVVKSCLEGKKSAEEAAAALTELAIARGSRDNISVVVVNLK